MGEHRWLHLALEAPLLAFGGVRIDQFGPTSVFPAASMLTGLIGNALGLDRADWSAHQGLQDRLVFAAWADHDTALLLVDIQNARLGKNDRGWTTWGQPEGRDGASYGAPHRRTRHYWMDARVGVVLRLADNRPTVEALGQAFDCPARPLFIGRKPCLPAGRLIQGMVTAADAHAALCAAVEATPSAKSRLRACWPASDGPTEGDGIDRIIAATDLRNWRTGLHAGSRLMVEGWVLPEQAAAA